MARYVNDDDFRPYPELIADGDQMWEIIDSRDTPGLPSVGMTDKVERILWVPFDAQGRVISQHEMAHVRFSPEGVPLKKLGVPILAMQAVEDGRVNLGLFHLGLPLRYDERLSAEVLDIIERDLYADDVVGLTLHALASCGTSIEPSIWRALATRQSNASVATVMMLVHEARERLERGRRRNRDVVASFWQGVRIARWLVKQLGKRGYVVPVLPDGGLVGCCGVAGTGVAARHGDASVGGVRPGRLRIVTAPLPHRCETPGPARDRRRWLARQEGTRFRHFSRFVTDQRVFGRPVRSEPRQAGTLLIDGSGSMRLGRAALERAIAAVPDAALVAIYAGSGDTGELRIVGRDGYRAAPEALHLGRSGNVVDLPALKWLAKQPGPRIWVSDGGVTGSGDLPNDAITKACRDLCRAAGIKQVRDTTRAAAALAASGRVGEAPRA